MRIERIRIDGFGRLVDFETGPEPLGSLVVVLGPNEAGKSTLFSFLTTALYGFSPASRELSPWIPWETDEAGGEIRLRLGDGSCAVVTRRLRSSPGGALTVDDETRDLRNHPLHWVEHVPRTVFRQVFAITLAELAGLDDDTWGRIQDRVLGSMGASDLRSAREVADALEKEAGEIWRPNRRGNQRLRDLQREIRALRSRRNDALERDRKIRSLVEERENVHLRLQDVRDDRLRDKTAVERMQELIPLKRQLDRIEELRAAGGPRAELAGLPDDLEAHRGRLVAEGDRARKALEELARDRMEPEAAVARFDTGSRSLLEHRDAVGAFLSRASEAYGDSGRQAELVAGRKEVEARLATAAAHLLSGAWGERTAECVTSVSVELLADRIARYEAAVRRERETSAAGSGVRAGAPLAATLALVAAGAGLLAWGLSGGPASVTAAGAACLAAGLTLGWLRRAEPGGVPEAAPSAAAELREEIARMLEDVPVREGFLDPPAPALAAELGRVQELAGQARECRRREDAHAARMAALDEQADEIRALLGRDGAGDAIDLARTLERELREAEARREAAEAARRELERMARSREGLEADLGRAEERLAELDGRIAELARLGQERPDPHAGGDRQGLAGGGTGARGTTAGGPAERAGGGTDSGARGAGYRGPGARAAEVHLVRRRLEAHARADRLEEELERAHPDLADRVARIRSAEQEGASWTVDEEDLARRKRRIEELDETIEELVARGEALERDAAHLREEETVDQVDGEVESLREQEARLIRQRDRKWLLARLVREADRRFREEHQPDLLRRASGYLARLTDGCYDRLLVDEDGDGALFQLMGPRLPAPVGLARPISTGTLEQAYLGLRLAIVDHLDQGEERLPLFLDEAFVNWDEERRERGLEVVAEVSRDRQVFAFTCHPEMARDLAGRGACVVGLRR